MTTEPNAKVNYLKEYVDGKQWSGDDAEHKNTFDAYKSYECYLEEKSN